MGHEFAKVAVNLATNKPIKAFTYKLPKDSPVAIGSLVVVPFRNSVKAGYVIGFDKQPDLSEIKSIISVVKELSLSEKERELSAWIAGTYITSEWSATRLFLPPGSNLRIKEESKAEGNNSMPQYSLKIRSVRKIANPELVYTENYEKPSQLTEEQSQAVSAVKKAITGNNSATFLLNGITGSGKTEVYAKAIEATLRLQKTTIVLVPEIAMSVQMVARLSSRFPGKVAILHSGLTQAERLSQWKLIKEGQIPIVIGARSAIFAPLSNLGLVIVDEEHDGAYKQNRSPRYHARDVAVKRALLEQATCVLGSATPSLESRYKCDSGEYKQLMLITKPAGSKIKIELADMKELDEKSLLSSTLINAIKDALKENQKVLLLLNRRGFASFLLCPSCGFVARCKRCSVSLTYHMTNKSLKCHHCDFEMEAYNSCPKCASSVFRFAGSGTQKLEQRVKELFPAELVIRLDRDNSNNKSASSVFKRFRESERAILLGTQIIGKGLDFADISLVGIVNADTSLNFPDFRAGEKTFQLLHQVAGRCGRGKKEGRVIIQTYNSEHYAIQAALKDNFEEFYAEEIKFREELKYPPFSRLINIGFSSQDPDKTKSAARALYDELKVIEQIEIMGPVEAPISILNGRHRWHILLKTAQEVPVKLTKILSDYSYKDVIVAIDVDPASLL